MSQNRIPPEKPQFLCGHCKDVLCNDCQSIASEYEFLHQVRSLELIRNQDEIIRLHREIAELRRDVEIWKDIAQIGYSDVIKKWMDSEVAKAIKAGRASMRREMKKSGLLDSLKKLETMRGKE